MVIGIFGSILIILIFALLTGIVFRYLQLPLVLGYLLIGAVAGPHAFGLLPDEASVKMVSSFGIIFLMFTIGLEFSISQLEALKYWVLGIGGLQVLLAILISTLIGKALGMTLQQAFVVGCIVAMSSTAIVTKELYQQQEVYSKVGKNTIAILLAQDLAVIPLIILLASFSGDIHTNATTELLLALLKGILAFSLIFFTKRWFLKPIFRIVSATKTLELFTFLVLLISLGTAWLTDRLGLSYALGAFLAGVMLSETDFRHQIEIEVRPFRDVLIGLFFITIGMLMDLTIWPMAWTWILLLVCALVFFKTILIAMLCKIAGDDYLTSCRTGIILAQGGEFGFAILTFSLTKNLLPADYGQVVLAAIWISIVLSPLLIRYNKQIATFLFPKLFRRSEALNIKEVSDAASQLESHVILCGFGHVGQNISRLLEIEQVPYVGLELDPVLVQNAKQVGKRVTFGDASHPNILNAAGFSKAKALVVSFSDSIVALKILNIVKNLRPEMPVLVRCKDETEINQLKIHGATRVIAEVFEEGLALAYHLLQIINIPEKRIFILMQEIRRRDYDLLRGVFSGAYDVNNLNGNFEQVRPVVLSKEAHAVNHRLGDLNIGVEVLAIRRGKSEHLKPHPNVRLHAEDIIVLFGDEALLEQAEKILLEGN